MSRTEIYRTETTKPLKEYLPDLTRIARENGFSISNEDSMNMGRTFARHGHPAPDDFDLHMIQLCKPDKALKSLRKNPDRAPLMPKFIVLYSRDGKTRIRLLTYGADLVAELLDDQEFPESLTQSFDSLKSIIDAAR